MTDEEAARLRIAGFLIVYLVGQALMLGAAWLTVMFGHCAASIMYPAAVLLWSAYSALQVFRA